MSLPAYVPPPTATRHPHISLGKAKPECPSLLCTLDVWHPVGSQKACLMKVSGERVLIVSSSPEFSLGHSSSCPGALGWRVGHLPMRPSWWSLALPCFGASSWSHECLPVPLIFFVEIALTNVCPQVTEATWVNSFVS